MKGRLRVQEFMVLTAGGVPIFHYSVEGTRKLDELLSGFLTAITSFASEFGERSVQSLSFEGSEIMYETGEKGILFIFLVDSTSPKKVLRTVLRDLSRKFQVQYQKDILKDIQIEEAYLGFAEDVQRAIVFYEGILGITSSLSAYVVPSIKEKAMGVAASSESLLDDFHRDFGGSGTRVLETIDGVKPIMAISEELGIEMDEAYEVVEYLVIWGVVSICHMCPKMQENDVRFDAFLDLIGLPNKDYQLLRRAIPLCNGSRSVPDISERLGIITERLYELLIKLGDQVEWKLVKVTGL
ncbi:MAG: hypothetical protein P1Q69_12255 [Candidatus Thorarchaeota archaeon]|nr:hypothetical protein [Candidatus Thorarchaeota archaeon]